SWLTLAGARPFPTAPQPKRRTPARRGLSWPMGRRTKDTGAPYAISTADCSGRPRIVESRETSASSSFRPGGVASANQAITRWSSLRDHVPETTPPAITMFAPRVATDLLAVGTTWGSAVPGPLTHWSYAGRSRVVLVAVVDANSSRCLRMTYVGSPSTSTGARRSPKAAIQESIRLRPAPSPAPSQ